MKKSILFSLALCLVPGILCAETIYLKNKSSISGTIQSFYEDKFVISTPGGSVQTIEKGAVEKIVFETGPEKAPLADKADASKPVNIPKSSADFSSPKKTFLYWKKAAEDGNTERIADCFLSAARDDQLAELKSYNKDKIKEMSKLTKGTDFSFSEPVYDGDRAYLSVTRKKGSMQRSEVVQFQKEGDNWKMLPE